MAFSSPSNISPSKSEPGRWSSPRYWTSAAGLIVGTGLKLLPSLRKNVLGIPLSAALGVLSFVAIAWLKLPLAWVLLGLGAMGCVVAFRRLA